MDLRRNGSRVLALCALIFMLIAQSAPAQDKPVPDGWQALADIPGTWIQDLSFVSAKVGYAAGGNPQILKTVDGGVTWTPVLDLEYGIYWYGVHALSADDVVISGFTDTPDTQQSLIKWTHDGGATWSDNLVVHDGDVVWANRVLFWNYSTGCATTAAYTPNLFRTNSGGLTQTDWSALTINNGEWFGAQFSALPNGHVRMSGIDYCESLDFAATWSCRPSIDEVFDGATFFLDDKRGWVGGGASSNDTPTGAEGWIHRTTDGGKTWSARTLHDNWAIREILFVNAKDGWAAGGAGSVGGVYVSHDGGQSWQVELDAGAELRTCSTADYHLFCAGYDNSATSHVFARDYDHIRVSEFTDALP